MQKVTPYSTRQGAARALDNGGRFYNIFTAAGDHVVSKAELSKAAGVLGGYDGAFLFFELATAGLTSRHREDLVGLFEPTLRQRYRRSRPDSLKPSEFNASCEAGEPYIVESRSSRRQGEETIDGVIMIATMIGKTPSVMPMPVSTVYDVLEVFDDPAPSGPGCLVFLKKGTKVPAGPIRWGGMSRRMEKGKTGEHRLYLEPAYYTPLA